MRGLTDDYLTYIDAAEVGGAIVVNNDESNVPQDSYGYTRELPGGGGADCKSACGGGAVGIGADGDNAVGIGADGARGRGAAGCAEVSAKKSGGSDVCPVRARDVWGYANSQETVGMSPAMYDEFFFTYIKEVANRFGLFAYGCCEPVHTLWEPCLSKLSNLRKVSVSPWCDEENFGDMIRGKKVVYHRKPSPNYISVDSVFDGGALLRHMERTVKAARGCPLEVTFRDITSVRGDPTRLARAVEITREAFTRWWQG
jgi:hypothetical protein